MAAGLAPTRRALLRFAAVLERRGEPCGDAVVRAAATVDQSAEQEENLRTLIGLLDRLGESDVLDQLRPEVERSFRVGHLYSAALARRGALQALEGYVRANVHPWEYATRVSGALPVLLSRAKEPAGRENASRLFEAWAAAARIKPVDQAMFRALVHVRTQVAQAWAFLGDDAKAKAEADVLLAAMQDADLGDRVIYAAELAPVCALLGDPRDLIAIADAAWDALFDEDLDGYGRLHRETITASAHRARHLRDQRALPREEWAWESPPSFAAPYVPPFSSRWNGYGATARIEQAMHEGRLEEAIAVLDGTTDGRVLTAFAESLMKPDLTPERAQLARGALKAALGRLDRPENKDGRYSVPAVCGAMARLGFLDDALALTSLADGVNLTLGSEARLRVCEVWLGSRGVLAGGRAALERVAGELVRHGVSSEVFTTPVSLAQLLLTLAPAS